ncbi:MAG: IS6 family transposase [Chloroflexota bacterium]
MNYTETLAVVCKFCGSKNVVKNGQMHGNQYYLCHTCGHTFAGNDALPGMRYPPEQIAAALQAFYEGLSLRAIQRQLATESGAMPSDSTVYEWVVRFSKVAAAKASGYKAQTGKIWAADETVLDVAGGRTKEGSPNTVWYWDVIDEDSRFLLASHMSLTRTIRDAEALFTQARGRAENAPHFIVTDRLRSYIDGIERVWGGDVLHIQSEGMAPATHNNTIERFHGSIKQRTKVMRGMQNRETAKIIMDGWLVHYNFFRPHEGLGGKTPGEVARVGFPYKSWRDMVTQGYHRQLVKVTG